ncbi:MAG: acetyl-CoA carboxylase biotin carboxyl carrier protein subunit [Flavobacteriales bacterium]|nr:acetyl-CoA carboxylase biotin carboxyl carrier protein subunit [Flavobacteriales bacterium]
MIKSKVNSNSYDIELDKESKHKGTIDNVDFEFSVISDDKDNFSITKNGVEYDIDIISSNPKNKTLQLLINGKEFKVALEDEFDTIVKKLGFKNKPKTTENQIKAHMPGLIVSIHAKAGDIVLKGQKLLTLEAMKMENIIKAPEDIKIKKVNVKKGNAVEKNDILFELD